MMNRMIGQRFHQRKRSFSFVAMVLFSGFFAYACGIALLKPGFAGSTTSLYISSNATGTGCTTADPCSLSNALGKVPEGGTIFLLSGNYASLVVGTGDANRFKAFTKPITITPASGAPVTTQGWDIRLSHITLKNIVSVGGSSYTRLGADYILFDNFKASGPAPSRYISIRSNNVTIRNSSFTNNVHDLVAMGEYTTTEPPNKNILIENSVFGPASVANNGQPYDSSTMDHVDCLQLFGGTDGVTIRNNTFFGCSNAEIIVKGDVNSDNKNVLIENNFMQTCTPGSYACGYYVLYVRNGTKYRNTNVIVRNNTIDGAVSIDRTMPGFSMVGNIITTFNGVPFGDCSGIGVEYNLITQSKCASNKSLPASNKIGVPTFVNPLARDYHLSASDTMARDFNVASAAASDIDGQSRSTKPDAGADEYVAAAAKPSTPGPTESGPIANPNPSNGRADAPLTADPFPADDRSVTAPLGQLNKPAATAKTQDPGQSSSSPATAAPPVSQPTTAAGQPQVAAEASVFDPYKILQGKVVAQLTRFKQPVLTAALALSVAATIAILLLWGLHLRHYMRYKNYLNIGQPGTNGATQGSDKPKI